MLRSREKHLSVFRPLTVYNRRGHLYGTAARRVNLNALTLRVDCSEVTRITTALLSVTGLFALALFHPPERATGPLEYPLPAILFQLVGTNR